MVDVAEVKIWGDRVGAVVWDDARGFASFEFDPKFLEKGLDLSPITMPIAGAISGNSIFNFPRLNFQTFMGLPGLLSDSLPDKFGTALLDRWLSEQGREIANVNPVERLCYTGTRGMGALEFYPPKKGIKDKKRTIEIERLVRLASEVLLERAGLHADLHHLDKEDILDIIRVGTSAGGARAKAVIAYNKHTGDIRSGQINHLNGYEYWIIKLDGVTNKQLGDPKGYGKIEYAYYLMAKDCGIQMSECRLKHEAERAHFMTKRFDRIAGDKLHMQSLCGLAHFDYNTPGVYSYEQAFQIIRMLKLHYPASEELFKRMCFNVIARNQDDHTKNISFLMDKSGNWSLSPAYDVIYAYNPAANWTNSHQMTINGKRDDILRSDLVTVAKNMNINRANEIIDQIVDVAADWPGYAKKVGIDREKIKAVQKSHVLFS